MPKHIVISANSAWNIANFRMGLVQSLLSKGYDVTALSPGDRHVNCLTDVGCRFIQLDMERKGVNPLTDAALFLSYLRTLQTQKPDIFLAYTIKPNIYGSLAAQLCGIPVVNTVTGLGTAFTNTSWLTHLVKVLYSLAFAGSHRVFFQNEEDNAYSSKEN